MLRAKQIGCLSQCARSFFLGGSRGTAADGASCTGSEDESGVSRNQSKTTNIHQSKTTNILSPRQTPTLLSKTATGAGAVLKGDAIGSADYHKSEGFGSVHHVLSTPSSSSRSDGVCHINGNVFAPHKDFGHSSGDQFIKGGLSTVDPVNHKLSTSDSKGNSPISPSCKVGSTGSFSNTKPSSEKSHKSDHHHHQSLCPNSSGVTKSHKRNRIPKAHAKSSTNVEEWSNTSYHHYVPKAKAEKATSMKGLQHVSNAIRGTSATSTKGLQHVPNTIRGTSGQIHNLHKDKRNKGEFLLHKSNTKLYSIPANLDSSKWVSKGKVAATKSIKSRGEVPQTVRFERKQAGYVPSTDKPVSAAHAIDHVHHILRQLKWGPAAEEALSNLNYIFNAYQANRILKLLQDHSVALGFFYWLKRQAGFKHDKHSYTTMVGIVGRARQFGAMRRLIEEMIVDGCHPNVVTYNRIIHSYGHANYIDQAVNVFYQMQEAGCQPDRVTYCTLIDIHAKAGYLAAAMDMYRQMQEVGLSPDTFTYGVIINCLGKAGRLSSAYKLFREMVSDGCVPNLVTYNIMITLQAKARNYPRALELYHGMQIAGVCPDMVTYSIVMEVLGHCGCLDEAEALFAEMKRQHWIPDECVYGLLIDLWGKAGNVDKARGWYQSMLTAGLLPNVPTCNSLVSACLKAHQFSDAHDVLQNMLKVGLQPSLQTYTLLLSCTDLQSPCDMWPCCELMAITGHPAHVFMLTMPAAEPDGQNVRDHASNFLDLMHSEDRESKRGLVDAVIDFLHKSGLKEEAGSVWEVAAQKNVYPDAVREKSASYWLINLHVMSDGTAVTALSRTLAWFHRQLLASGIGPNRIDIVTGWGKRSRVTGSSMVRQSVHELLHLFRFPFTSNGNAGCFIGCGEPLNRWLLHSYVERMHLL